ncbi:hypothetical protein [Sporosarcina sp. Te-1]|uniref:hypothetical protein n=1 Tax=Sporosarcina sp. Te-1 TaxID=2818390 RepID=UPI001A9E2DE6|nr:hypothetical protein [Sporosarcina sp. Te-1]QTD39662.1 hypothetical protein J3U78_12470 [Sporosarcina sp. Te-1]
MKRILFLCLLLLTLPAVGACHGSGYSTIQLRTVQADETMEATDVIPFRIKGKVPDDEIYVFTIEKYEDGESLGDSFLTFGDLTAKADMGFGVTSDRQQNRLTLSFQKPNGVTSVTTDGTTEYGAIGTMLKSKKDIPLEESVYIAYWIGSDDGTFHYSSLNEEGYASLIKNKQCYLVKMERQKWSNNNRE